MTCLVFIKLVKMGRK